jgi:hypothetical protein
MGKQDYMNIRGEVDEIYADEYDISDTEEQR